jgi:hypothetical protein
MRRFVVVAVIVALGNASVAFAGETLRDVATRVTREVSLQKPLAPKPAAATSVQKNWANALGQEPAVSASGMRKRTKVLIYLAAAVAVVGTWYKIDHSVEDNTPSTLGTRQD